MKKRMIIFLCIAVLTLSACGGGAAGGGATDGGGSDGGIFSAAAKNEARPTPAPTPEPVVQSAEPSYEFSGFAEAGVASVVLTRYEFSSADGLTCYFDVANLLDDDNLTVSVYLDSVNDMTDYSVKETYENAYKLEPGEAREVTARFTPTEDPVYREYFPLNELERFTVEVYAAPEINYKMGGYLSKEFILDGAAAARPDLSGEALDTSGYGHLLLKGYDEENTTLYLLFYKDSADENNDGNVTLKPLVNGVSLNRIYFSQTHGGTTSADKQYWPIRMDLFPLLMALGTDRPQQLALTVQGSIYGEEPFCAQYPAQYPIELAEPGQGTETAGLPVVYEDDDLCIRQYGDYGDDYLLLVENKTDTEIFVNTSDAAGAMDGQDAQVSFGVSVPAKSAALETISASIWGEAFPPALRSWETLETSISARYSSNTSEYLMESVPVRIQPGAPSGQ